MRFGKFGLTAFALALTASTATAGEIVLNSDQSDPAPKKAMEGLIADFEKAPFKPEVRDLILKQNAIRALGLAG